MDWLAQQRPVEGTDAHLRRAGDAADGGAPTCRPDETLEAVSRRMDDTGWDACAAVNAAGIFQGLLRRSALDRQNGNGKTPVSAAMYPAAATFRPDSELSAAHEYMDEHGLSSVAVTNSDAVFIGLLRREDAWQ